MTPTFWYRSGMVPSAPGRRSSSPGYTNRIGYSCLSPTGRETLLILSRSEAIADSGGEAVFFNTSGEAPFAQLFAPAPRILQTQPA